MTELLNNAQKKENEIAIKIAGTLELLVQKPLFHFSSPAGAIYTASGIALFQKKLHLFYEWNPSYPENNSHYIGHASTQNLLNWDSEPVTLAPDEKYDAEGCLSGSVICKNGKIILAYTSVSDEKDLRIQQQSIAFGEEKSFDKIESNPAVTNRNIPFIYEKTDFRNPKIWEENNSYYMVCTVKKSNKTGAIVLFNSSDMKNWFYVSTIDENKTDAGKMWENPELFNMNGKDFILITAKDMKESKKDGFSKGTNSLYMTGFLNRQTWTFDREIRPENENTLAPVDYGIDFYAPQTIPVPDGRRIMIASMGSPDDNITPEEYLWSGMMTIPREIELHNGKLFQFPVRELKEIRINRVTGEIMPKDNVNIKGLDGRHFELDVEVQIMDNEAGFMALHIGENEESFVEVRYNAKKGTISFDRSRTKYPGKTSYREVPVKLQSTGMISFQCIIDIASIEIFVNGGELAFTNTFFVDPKVSGVSVQSKLQTPIKFNYYHLGTPIKI